MHCPKRAFWHSPQCKLCTQLTASGLLRARNPKNAHAFNNLSQRAARSVVTADYQTGLRTALHKMTTGVCKVGWEVKHRPKELVNSVSEIALVYRKQIQTKAKASTVIRSSHAGLSASGRKHARTLHSQYYSHPRIGHFNPVTSGYKAGLGATVKLNHSRYRPEHSQRVPGN